MSIPTIYANKEKDNNKQKKKKFIYEKASKNEAKCKWFMIYDGIACVCCYVT